MVSFLTTELSIAQCCIPNTLNNTEHGVGTQLIFLSEWMNDLKRINDSLGLIHLFSTCACTRSMLGSEDAKMTKLRSLPSRSGLRGRFGDFYDGGTKSTESRSCSRGRAKLCRKGVRRSRECGRSAQRWRRLGCRAQQGWTVGTSSGEWQEMELKR